MTAFEGECRDIIELSEHFKALLFRHITVCTVIIAQFYIKLISLGASNMFPRSTCKE